MAGNQQTFLTWVKLMASQGDHWYIWGAQGPNEFDCSGFVCYGGYKAGLWPQDFDTTADGFWKTYPHVQVPQPADLCLYGASAKKATHVTVFIGNDRQIGASGGGSSTTTVAKAKERNARVKEAAVNYRGDLLGHVRLPFAPPQSPSTDLLPFTQCAAAVQWCNSKGYILGDGQGNFVNLPLSVRVANTVLARAGRPALDVADPHPPVTRGMLQTWINQHYAASNIDILSGRHADENLRLISLCFVLWWLAGSP
jgi:murein DD-endopeptidase